MSANFGRNTLTQSEAIETYTPYDVTSSRPRKTKIAFFCQLWRDRKILLRAGTELKFENCESMQHRLQFSGIKKGAKISFHRHFKREVDITVHVGLLNFCRFKIMLLDHPHITHVHGCKLDTNDAETLVIIQYFL